MNESRWKENQSRYEAFLKPRGLHPQGRMIGPLPPGNPQTRMTMDAELELAFAPLKHAIEQQELSDVDLLDFIGGYALDNPRITQALAFHARDYLIEAGSSDVTYSAVIAEVYRRTFFDPDTSKLYGTDGVFASRDALREFADMMTQRLTVDTLQVHPGSFISAPTQQQ